MPSVSPTTPHIRSFWGAIPGVLPPKAFCQIGLPWESKRATSASVVEVPGSCEKPAATTLLSPSTATVSNWPLAEPAVASAGKRVSLKMAPLPLRCTNHGRAVPLALAVTPAVHKPPLPSLAALSSRVKPALPKVQSPTHFPVDSSTMSQPLVAALPSVEAAPTIASRPSLSSTMSSPSSRSLLTVILHCSGILS